MCRTFARVFFNLIEPKTHTNALCLQSEQSYGITSPAATRQYSNCVCLKQFSAMAENVECSLSEYSGLWDEEMKGYGLPH